MQTTHAGIRELKSRLSDYLKQVKSGHTVIITEHGKPIGQIIPMTATLEERLQALAQAGLISQAGKRLPAPKPTIINPNKQTIASLVSEDRDVEYRLP